MFNCTDEPRSRKLAQFERFSKERGSPGLWSNLLATPVAERMALVMSQDAAPEDRRIRVRRSGNPTPALELADDDARALWFDGRHLENLVLVDLLVWRDGQAPAPEVTYWRTTTDREVDFVVESGERLLAIEVKAATQPRIRDITGLKLFQEEYADRFLGGLLLHAGSQVEWLADGILAAPWWRVL